MVFMSSRIHSPYLISSIQVKETNLNLIISLELVIKVLHLIFFFKIQAPLESFSITQETNFIFYTMSTLIIGALEITHFLVGLVAKLCYGFVTKAHIIIFTVLVLKSYLDYGDLCGVLNFQSKNRNVHVLKESFYYQQIQYLSLCHFKTCPLVVGISVSHFISITIKFLVSSVSKECLHMPSSSRISAHKTDTTKWLLIPSPPAWLATMSVITWQAASR